jgi:hypothetical protein
VFRIHGRFRRRRPDVRHARQRAVRAEVRRHRSGFRMARRKSPAAYAPGTRLFCTSFMFAGTRRCTVTCAMAGVD